MAGPIHLLSGGAAQAVVEGLQRRFLAESGCTVQGTFGAVGAMRDKLLAGDPCDLVILTQALVDQLAAGGHLVPASDKALGVVKTGMALMPGRQVPDAWTRETLKAALLAASAIYCPDPVKATAGIHFMKVLVSLGIEAQVAARLKTFPNGAAAMREMAGSGDAGSVGCTQVTEIRYTPGVQPAGLLPPEFELATVYTAALCSRAPDPAAAASFIAMLAGPDTAPVRKAAGFE